VLVGARMTREYPVSTPRVLRREGSRTMRRLTLRETTTTEPRRAHDRLMRCPYSTPQVCREYTPCPASLRGARLKTQQRPWSAL
jgi:hypothetical protein